MEKKHIKAYRKMLIEELKNYEGKTAIVLPVDSNELKEILFDKDEEGRYKFIWELLDVYNKIDISNISFSIKEKQEILTSKFQRPEINPQNICGKDMSDTICTDVKFISPFINPQNICGKYIQVPVNDDFHDSFDEVDIEESRNKIRKLIK